MNPKVALLIYSKLEGAGLSAVYRAMMFAQEMQRAGDDVVLVFDGAGSTAAAEMAVSGHALHGLWSELKPQLLGVCRHCARSYGVLDAIDAAGMRLLGEDRGHASLRALLLEGRQIITF